MISNTTPFGTASATSILGTTSAAWKAFDGVGGAWVGYTSNKVYPYWAVTYDFGFTVTAWMRSGFLNVDNVNSAANWTTFLQGTTAEAISATDGDWHVLALSSNSISSGYIGGLPGENSFVPGDYRSFRWGVSAYNPLQNSMTVVANMLQLSGIYGTTPTPTPLPTSTPLPTPTPTPVIVELIPKMVDDSRPSGTADSEGEGSFIGHEAWRAFDKVVGDYWIDTWHLTSSSALVTSWISYDFGVNQKVIIKKLSGSVYMPSDKEGQNIHTIVFGTSGDPRAIYDNRSTTPHDYHGCVPLLTAASFFSFDRISPQIINSLSSFRGIRIEHASKNINSNFGSAASAIQVYGYFLPTATPVPTPTPTPVRTLNGTNNIAADVNAYGHIYASSQMAGLSAFHAFDNTTTMWNAFTKAPSAWITFEMKPNQYAAVDRFTGRFYFTGGLSGNYVTLLQGTATYPSSGLSVPWTTIYSSTSSLYYIDPARLPVPWTSAYNSFRWLLSSTASLSSVTVVGKYLALYGTYQYPTPTPTPPIPTPVPTPTDVSLIGMHISPVYAQGHDYASGNVSTANNAFSIDQSSQWTTTTTANTAWVIHEFKDGIIQEIDRFYNVLTFTPFQYGESFVSLIQGTATYPSSGISVPWTTLYSCQPGDYDVGYIRVPRVSAYSSFRWLLSSTGSLAGRTVVGSHLQVARSST